jgi:microcystin-dependent protein
MFGGNFAPQGWAFCDGAILAISEYETLFNLIGTTFGGDGQSTFGVPDLRGRIPVHMSTTQAGSTYSLGSFAGTESVTLTGNQIPSHAHAVTGELNMKTRASNPDNQLSPIGNAIAIAPGKKYFSRNPSANGFMGPLSTNITLNSSGANIPHNNMQPYVCVNFIISLFGVFPTTG